ncbi:MAG: sigma-70 family RNA polymerase sigma factor [Gammaproteobacteria bacterium]
MDRTLSNPERWLDLYGNVLYRYAAARVRQSEVAEDLVQDTLLAALRAQAGFAGKSSERTWLIGILKHKIVDYYRKTSDSVEQAFDERFSNDEDGEFFDSSGHWRYELSSWSNPDKAIEQEQFYEVLKQCIDRLPERMAQLFVLREFDGLESEQICEMLALSSMNNFWVSLSRVRVRLRHCLDENWFNR